MKKVILISFAAIAAVIILCSAAAAVVTSGDASDGSVCFESSAAPSLNFTMPVSRAEEIFRLMPESVTSVCRQEYAVVRGKCNRSSSFTHEGVRVTCSVSDPSLVFVFSVEGYRLTVKDVSWATLDRIFGAGK